MDTGSNKKKNTLVPEPALRRMPCYLAYLKLEHRRGSQYVSSTLIARDNGVDPTQVTKDLSYTGIAGKTRVGYEVEPLINALEDFLGFKVMDEAYLFGAGSLGTALLHDHGLVQYGLKIKSAFDVDSNVVGKEISGVNIYHLDQIMISNGIKAIWNFTPVRIVVPDNVVIQNTSLYAHLAVMFNRLNSLPETED
jgi:redox-sensing transcriptional repressor